MFINGRPFVLRENGRPYKNMQEYNGIDGDRLESMEARLKVITINKPYEGPTGGRTLPLSLLLEQKCDDSLAIPPRSVALFPTSFLLGGCDC